VQRPVAKRRAGEESPLINLCEADYIYFLNSKGRFCITSALSDVMTQVSLENYEVIFRAGNRVIMCLSEPSFLRQPTKTELASEDRVPQKKPLEFFRGTERLRRVTRTEPTTEHIRNRSGLRFRFFWIQQWKKKRYAKEVERGEL
jgi:hypothetical protein